MCDLSDHYDACWFPLKRRVSRLPYLSQGLGCRRQFIALGMNSQINHRGLHREALVRDPITHLSRLTMMYVGSVVQSEERNDEILLFGQRSLCMLI